MSGEQADRLQYEFGPFVLNPERRMLSREGVVLSLPPKAFDTLLILVEARDRIVPKDELLNAIWPQTFVEENNLNQSVSLLRKVLRDSPVEHRYIATIPGKGYRFVAEVRAVSESAESSEHPRIGKPSERRNTLSAAIVLVLLLSAAGYLALVSWRTQPPGPLGVKSIAVLPFRPVGAGERDEFLEVGMADALITKLSNLRELQVLPTSMTRKYSDGNHAPSEAGRELRVDAVLEGSIQRVGDRLRITVQLIRVSDGISLWADRFDEKFTGIFALQDSMSEQVSRALLLKLSGEERRELRRHYTENTEAYMAYLKGRYYWTRVSGGGKRRAIEYFEQAIKIEPRYALAYAGLADCYGFVGSAAENSEPPRVTMLKAKEAALKALEIDEELAEAHASLGLTKLRFDWDWAGAERELLRAMQLNDRYAPAYAWYADYLSAMGRFDEAISAAKRAYELDPVSLFTGWNAGRTFIRLGLYDQAIEQYRKALELDPEFPMAHLGLGLALEQQGMHDEAIAEFILARKYSGDRPGIAAALANAYAVAGKRAEALEILSELEALSKKRYVSPASIATIHAGLGNADRAFEWLDRAFEERSAYMVRLKTDQRLDPLRHDPRFRDLVKRVGLPE